MKPFRRVLVPFLLSYLLYGAFVFATSLDLPDPVASHFNGAGRPDGWMSRARYLLFISLFGFCFPLVIAASTSITRLLPDRFINIPHRSHWLAPERRAATFDFLTRHSFAFGHVAIGFVGGVHWTVARANQHHPPRLEGFLLLPIVLLFLAATAFYIYRLVNHFRFPDDGNEAAG
jgi:serine/threonine-protein kinase